MASRIQVIICPSLGTPPRDPEGFSPLWILPSASGPPVTALGLLLPVPLVGPSKGVGTAGLVTCMWRWSSQVSLYQRLNCPSERSCHALHGWMWMPCMAAWLHGDVCTHLPCMQPQQVPITDNVCGVHWAKEEAIEGQLQVPPGGCQGEIATYLHGQCKAFGVLLMALRFEAA